MELGTGEGVEKDCRPEGGEPWRTPEVDGLALLLGAKSFKPLEGESIENRWFEGSLDVAGVDIKVMEVAED